MKSKTKVMLLSVLMAAVFGVCNLGGVARLSFVSKAAPYLTITPSSKDVDFGAPVTIDNVVTDGGIDVTTDVTSDPNGAAWTCAPTGAATVNGKTVTFNQAGTITLTAEYNDGSTGIFGSATFNVKPKITASESTATKRVTDTFEQTFTANAGTATVMWNVTDDHATGITSIGNDGKLTQALTKEHIGTHNLKVTASVGTVSSAEYAFTLTVKPRDPGKITLDTVTGKVDEDFDGQLSAAIDDAKVVTWTSSELPEGLSLDPATGKITGKPKKKETKPVTFTADNGSGSPSSESIEISISDVTKGVAIKDGSTVITALTMQVGEKKTITAEVDTTSSDKSVQWDSTNKTTIGIANNTGTTIEVTALKAGTASLTATSKADPAKVGSIAITVNDKPVAVTGVTLSPNTAQTISLNEKVTFTAKVAPDNATNKKVTWNSSDTAVATVDANGVVTGVKAGTTNITAITEDGKLPSTPVSVTVDGNKPLITTASLEKGATNTAYTAVTLAANGAGTKTWTWEKAGTSTELPPGMNLDKTTGVLSGTPTKAGTYTVKITVTSSASSIPDSKEFTIVIEDKELSSTVTVSGTVDGNPVTDVTSSISDYVSANSKTLAETGKIVQVELLAQKLAPASVDKRTDIDRLTKVAFHGYADNEITIAYLNLDIYKRVKNPTDTDFPARSDGGKIKDTGTPIEIGLKMDSTTLGKRPVITRIHGDQTKNFVSIGTKPTSSRDYVDGTYFIDTNNGILYLYSRYFSVYTIAYADNAHLVTFNLDGGTGVPEQLMVRHGATLANLTEPTKTGENFDGWFTDAAKNNLWNDTDAVNADMALFASWTTGQSSNRAPRSNTNTDDATETDERSVRGSRTGDNKEAERIARLLAIMTTTWIVLFNALAFGKKRRQRIRRR